jgi:hypothetical protein
MTLTGIFIFVAIERLESQRRGKSKTPRLKSAQGFWKISLKPSGSLAVFLRGASRLKSPRELSISEAL